MCRSFCAWILIKLFCHVGGEITAPVKVAGIARRFGIVGDVLSGPAGEVEPPVRPDPHQFSPYIQAEIVIHAPKGLTCAEFAGADDGNSTAIHALVIKVQEQGCRAETAADDADVCAHAGM